MLDRKVARQMCALGSPDEDAAVRRLTVDAEREPAQRSVHSTANICGGMNGILRQLGFRRSSSIVCRHRQRLEFYDSAPLSPFEERFLK